MSKKNKQRSKFSKLLFPEGQSKKDFKNNQERFRLFNKYEQEPPRISFMLGTMGSVCFSIVPFLVHDSYFSTLSIILLILGFCITVIFEWIANYHYSSYSKIAKDRKYDSIIFNIRVNYTLRTIAMLGWIITVLAITLILTKNSNLISLFQK